MIEAGDSFTWGGAELGYLAHPYNRAAENERAVEVPIALHWIRQQTGQGLEVGNVLSHYEPIAHRVVDLYEQAPGVDNLDLFDVHEVYDWIVAISTLEHVYWDADNQDDPTGPMEAVEHLRTLLRPGGALLVTAPFGQHPYFDCAILDGALGPDTEDTLVHAVDRWIDHPDERLWRPAREHGWAGAVWIATWQA